MTDARRRVARWWTTSAASLLCIFGFLPLADWLETGLRGLSVEGELTGWLAGSTIAIGIGVVFLIASRTYPSLWREDALAPLVRGWSGHPRSADAFLAAGAFSTYAFTARRVFGARPLLVDEITQLFQARQFANGRLGAFADSAPEFFSTLLVFQRDGRVYSQFPPGGPLLLALGVLAGAAWLVVPLCGGFAAWCFAALTRRLEPDRPGVSLLASLLFACAPFMMFMSGSHMNHVPALLGIVLALWSVEHATSIDLNAEARFRWAIACGAAIGGVATIRPLDAAAFVVPVAVWLVWRGTQDRREIRNLGGEALGLAGPILLLLWYDSRTTGAPLRFGYEAVWGTRHSIGFHASPWGTAHTPRHGLQLVSRYFFRLQSILFETPVPSLVASIGALGLATRLRRMDRVLLSGSACLIGLYFAYWHEGDYLGPRFFTCLLPVLALWSARLPSEWCARMGRGSSYRVMVAASVVSVTMAIAFAIPLRAAQYRGVLPSMRIDIDSLARSSGVHDAVVLVRESWGAQLLARLSLAGLTPGEAQLVYRSSDACVLDGTLRLLEVAGASHERARDMLLRVAADSSRLGRSTWSPDASERVLPGSRYGARCVRRLEEDRGGYVNYLPFILSDSPDIMYARDLHARDSVLLMRFPHRRVYLVGPVSRQEGTAAMALHFGRYPGTHCGESGRGRNRISMNWWRAILRDDFSSRCATGRGTHVSFMLWMRDYGRNSGAVVELAPRDAVSLSGDNECLVTLC